MTVILIMLVQALPVWIIAVAFKNRTLVTVSAIIMSLMAVATGSAAFVLIDLLGIGIAYWIGLTHIASLQSSMSPDGIQSGSKFQPSGGAVRNAPSDLLNLPATDYIAGVRTIFGTLNENALIMTLVAYVNQEALLAVIEGEDELADDVPKSLDELIRSTDPFLSSPPDEISSRRRYWFTMAGLLLRAERMAATNSDAYDFCVDAWIRIVTAARLIPDALPNNRLWSEEEKDMLTLGIGHSPRGCMLAVHSMRVPRFVRRDLRMKKVECVTIHGMTEEKWDAWQREEKEGMKS